jgi:S-layer protein (TIGR01567 family)
MWPIILLNLATMILLIAGSAAEIRGPVAYVIDGETYSWDAKDFAGFYYNIDEGIGTESITLNITDNALQEDTGVVYETAAQKVEFDFNVWGHYYVMGFLGTGYFAGYADGLFHEESEDENLLTDEKLSRILIDSDREINAGSGTLVELGQGYDLAINSIDPEGNEVFLQLYKNGAKVDSWVVSPSNETTTESTYIYKRDLGGTRGVVVIAAHLKSAFRGLERDRVIIDGIWQISDTTLRVSEGDEYEQMTVEDVDSEGKRVTMTNKGQKIVLSRNRDRPLMGDFGIKTVDQKEVSPDNPLRFYIYKEI